MQQFSLLKRVTCPEIKIEFSPRARTNLLSFGENYLINILTSFSELHIRKIKWLKHHSTQVHIQKILSKLLEPEERSSDLTLKRQSTKYEFVFSTPHYVAPPPSSLISQISPGSRVSQDTSPDGRLESWNGGNYFIKINWKKYTTEENVFSKQVSTSETLLVKGFNFG